ncbi:hypothetical protein ACFX1X_020366 [Malus domestica]
MGGGLRVVFVGASGVVAVGYCCGEVRDFTGDGVVLEPEREEPGEIVWKGSPEVVVSEVEKLELGAVDERRNGAVEAVVVEVEE